MILSEMKTALMRYGFDTTDPLTIWLNWGMAEVEKANAWKTLEAIDTVPLIAGDRVFFGSALVTGPVKKIISIKVLGQDGPMERVSRQQWQKVVADDTSLTNTGVPQRYHIQWQGKNPNNLEVWIDPRANEAETLEVFYTITETPFNDAVPGDTTEFLPDSLHQAIVLRAAVFGLQAEDEDDRADKIMGTYNASIFTAVSDGDKSEGPYFVQDVMDYGC